MKMRPLGIGRERANSDCNLILQYFYCNYILTPDIAYELMYTHHLSQRLTELRARGHVFSQKKKRGDSYMTYWQTREQARQSKRIERAINEQ